MRRTRRWITTAACGIATLALTAPVAGALTGGTAVPTPNPGTSNSIDGVVALSPTEVWGIGNASSPTYNGCHGRTLTTRFTGTVFAEVPSTPTAICAAINGVAGSSTSDIWAVGSTNSARDPHLRHWNGSTWTVDPGAAIALPPSGGRRLRTTSLNAVAAIRSNDVWAVGKAMFADSSRNALVEHWNGTAWSLVPVPTPAGSELNAVGGTGPSDVWAVGSGGAAGSATQSTLVLHWNGTKWSTVSSPNANALNVLRGVTAISPTDVWAVGDSIKSPFDGVSVYSPLVLHWNGSAWSSVAVPKVGKGSNSLAAIAARSANDVWAVGFSDDITGAIPIRRTLAQHWNGTSWSVVASANPGTGDNWLRSVVAPAGTTQVFASGTSAAGTLIERFSS
jgi:hypothetical protein